MKVKSEMSEIFTHFFIEVTQELRYVVFSLPAAECRKFMKQAQREKEDFILTNANNNLMKI